MHIINGNSIRFARNGPNKLKATNKRLSMIVFSIYCIQNDFFSSSISNNLILKYSPFNIISNRAIIDYELNNEILLELNGTKFRTWPESGSCTTFSILSLSESHHVEAIGITSAMHSNRVQHRSQHSIHLNLKIPNSKRSFAESSSFYIIL